VTVFGGHVSPQGVLIVSDDTEFARAVVARWQAERHVPEITVLTSDVWNRGVSTGSSLVILGPVRDGDAKPFLAALNSRSSVAVVFVAAEEREALAVRADHPSVLAITRQDGWANTLVLLASEALRRIDAVSRAHRAEHAASECQGQALLGRYMQEMRPSISNALTSVLGNADLLLLDSGYVAAESREQLQTIHSMALRLHEIMQRFSSLSSELRIAEKESQGETPVASHGLVLRP
jgi:signal transduction histidine kinase